MQMQSNYFRQLIVISCVLLASCATSPKPVSIKPSPKLHSLPKENVSTVDPKIFRDGINLQLLKNAEAHALPANARVLKQARIMTVNQKVILPGGCWDYINAVWNKAGFPIKKRRTIFKGSKTGSYASAAKIQSGDWLYFINHDYGNIEHSAMFIDWADKNNMQGYMLSYAGQRRAEPARYKIYDLTSVYQVIRPKE